MEKRIILQLSFPGEPRALKPWLVAALLLAVAGELASESVTLTTYYPAPSGVYTQLITTGQTLFNRDASGLVGIGTSNPLGAFDVEGPSGQNFIFNTNGRVGLGTTNPAGSLDVEGPANGDIVFNTGGQVGIGYTKPTMELQVNGDIMLKPSCSESQVSYATCTGGSSPVCSGSQYVTAVSGVYAKQQVVQPPFQLLDTSQDSCNTAGFTVYFLCCSCPAGGCPSL